MLRYVIALVLLVGALLPAAALAEPLPPGTPIRANFTNPWRPPNDPQVVDRPQVHDCTVTRRFPSSYWLDDERIDCADDIWVEVRLGVSWQPDVVIELWYLPDHYYVVNCSTPHVDDEPFTCYDFG
jgi:hypothetical protein